MKTRIILLILVVLSFLVFVEKSDAPPNRDPIAVLEVAGDDHVVEGTEVVLDAKKSKPGAKGRDAEIILYEWDFDYDGNFVCDYSVGSSGNPVADYVYTTVGIHEAALRVTDNEDNQAIGTCTVYVRTESDILVPFPVQTIQEAIDIAVDGYTIIVSEGTYYEDIDFKGKKITVQGTYPNDWNIVESTVIEGSVEFNEQETFDSAIKGFKIRSSTPFIGNGIVVSDSGIDFTYPLIANCIIEDHYNGIACYGDNAPHIQNCKIRNNKFGIYTTGGSTAFWAVSCWIYNNEQGIAMVNYEGGGNVIANNTIVGNTNCGVNIRHVTLALENNILWDNGDDINAMDDQLEPEYCCIEDGDDVGINGNIDDNPLFVDASNNDYHLQAISPCVDGARTWFTRDHVCEHTDIDGEPRFMDGDNDGEIDVDMGADEHNLVIWYVDCEVEQSGDGTSWAEAFKTLQEALEYNPLTQVGNQDLGENNEIWVAEGIYKPDEPLNDNDQNAHFRFKLVNRVHLYGGFRGKEVDYPGETLREERDWIINETILSGDVDDDSQLNSGNSNCILKSLNTNNFVTLDGFTITGGYGSLDGAGFRKLYGAAEVKNCRFYRNINGASGGGLYNGSGELSISNCIFEDNKAFYGGGLYNESGNVSISNCIFNENTACQGGAIANWDTALIRNCLFLGNYANDYHAYGEPVGGGAIWTEAANMTRITNSTFYQNQAYGGDRLGAALYNDVTCNVEVENCIIWGDAEAVHVYTDEDATVDFKYSDIKGSFDGEVWDESIGNNWNESNIDEDPIFMVPEDPHGIDGLLGTADDGLYLDYPSPCLDAGSNAYTIGTETDIAGNDRRVDSIFPFDGAIVDMGAYENAKIIVFYVDKNVDGGNETGLDWENAFLDIQSAIDAAEGETCKCEIWVADGTYLPSKEGIPGDGRSVTFALLPGLKLYGGFRGKEGEYPGEALRVQRNPVDNPTILSGDIDDDGILNDGNCYHVVLGADNARLDGFTIKMGYTATLPNGGGGMRNESCSPIVANCVFEQNMGAYGGGMYNEDNDILVENCHFVGNAGTYGAGVYNGTDNNGQFIDCVFLNNTSSSNGGGICNAGNDTLVQNCRFESNISTGGAGAGVFNGTESSGGFIDCVFLGNVADSSGGGAFNNNGVSAKTTFIGCKFLGNSAARGGGIVIGVLGNTDLINCLFSGNEATNGDGGGIRCDTNYDAVITNCTISLNSASNFGGGLDMSTDSSPVITNCIIYDNTAAYYPNIYPPIPPMSDAIINYCDIEGGWGAGEGNIDEVPLFINPFGEDGYRGTEDDDFHLDAISPCVDTGKTDALPSDIFDLDEDEDVDESIPYDLDHLKRRVNYVVDRGAYEFNYHCFDPNEFDVSDSGLIDPNNYGWQDFVVDCYSVSTQFLVEDSSNCPGGENGQTQSGSCIFPLSLLYETDVALTVEGNTERHMANYDFGRIYIDGREIVHVQGTSEGEGCEMQFHEDSDVLTLEAGEYLIKFEVDTNDGKYHVGTYFNFTIEVDIYSSFSGTELLLKQDPEGNESCKKTVIDVQAIKYQLPPKPPVKRRR